MSQNSLPAAVVTGSLRAINNCRSDTTKHTLHELDMGNATCIFFSAKRGSV